MLDVADLVSQTARTLGIETAVIGAMALAAHGYIRGTVDFDLAAHTDPNTGLLGLKNELEAKGLLTQLNLPDEDDPIGGVLKVFRSTDNDGEPVDPVEIVNFHNPLRPTANPGRDAIENATPPDERGLRYTRLPELIALKLYAGGRSDLADVVELLRKNPDADHSTIQEVCSRFDLEATFGELLAETRPPRST